MYVGSASYSHDKDPTNVSVQSQPKRPLVATVVYSDGVFPFYGAKVYLDSWNGAAWTQRHSGTAGIDGKVSLQAFPTADRAVIACASTTAPPRWPITNRSPFQYRRRRRLYACRLDRPAERGDFSGCARRGQPAPAGRRNFGGRAQRSGRRRATVEVARKQPPTVNPVVFTLIPYGQYTVDFYCWDMVTARLGPISCAAYSRIRCPKRHPSGR